MEANISMPLPSRFPKLRILMYADDAVILLKTITKDVKTLVDIHANFGQVTFLCTNIAKSSISPTKWESMDLGFILHDF
jgi:hypothetical protein